VLEPPVPVLEPPVPVPVVPPDWPVPVCPPVPVPLESDDEHPANSSAAMAEQETKREIERGRIISDLRFFPWVSGALGAEALLQRLRWLS
jgi:hypothetical protein